MLDISRIDNVHYLKFLVHKYHSSGWNVYSNILEIQEDLPVDWTGPEPDLLFIKKKRSIAVCVESLSSLKDETILGKWKEILKVKEIENPYKTGSIVTLHVKLMVLTGDIKACEIAKHIAKTHSIQIDCHVIKEVTRKKITKKAKSLLQKSKLEKLIILFGIIILMGFLYVASYFIVSYIKANFKIRDYYQPFDRDRIKNK